MLLWQQLKCEPIYSQRESKLLVNIPDIRPDRYKEHEGDEQCDKPHKDPCQNRRKDKQQHQARDDAKRYPFYQAYPSSRGVGILTGTVLFRFLGLCQFVYGALQFFKSLASAHLRQDRKL